VQLTWFKNGQRLVPSQKYQINYTNQQASLKISQVTADDTGHYTLLAENPQGKMIFNKLDCGNFIATHTEKTTN
jgi:Immunoglobulin I-set domain.